MASDGCNNLIIVSDIHAGCRMGLCPPEGIDLADGGHYTPSPIMLKVWSYWQDFWSSWVPEAAHHEPYDVLVNGDLLDGVHHRTTTQISHNLQDQKNIAVAILTPIRAACRRLFITVGTEVHAGVAGVDEEGIARDLGTTPDSTGRFARYELWYRCGRALVHAMHHIGTTASSAHEASAVNAELSAEYVEAARWGQEPPDYVIRSHRHRSIAVDLDSSKGYAAAIVTPGWQAKTPFAYRMAGARLAPPQFGGYIIRQGDHEFYYRRKLYRIDRGEVENEQTPDNHL